MTPLAITMMLVAMITIWGGLIASILFMRKHPAVPEAELADPDAAVADAN